MSFSFISTSWEPLLPDPPCLDESESRFIQDDAEDPAGEGSLEDSPDTGQD